MYKSPISVECEKIVREITEKQDCYIVSETIRLTGVKVDKDELIKALSYDRGQYEKGYADGKADAEEVKHGRWLMTDAYPHKVYCSECYATLIPNVEWFKTYNIASNYCPNCGASMQGEEE